MLPGYRGRAHLQLTIRTVHADLNKDSSNNLMKSGFPPCIPAAAIFAHCFM